MSRYAGQWRAAAPGGPHRRPDPPAGEGDPQQRCGRGRQSRPASTTVRRASAGR